MGIFLAGFAEIDVTPPPGCELTGYAVADRLAEGRHDPLRAVAVVLDDRGQKSLLCSVDLCVIHADVTAVVRKRVSKATAIPAERIMIAATHTHSGPKLMNSDRLENQRWVRELEDRLTKVMMLSDYHRVPAVLHHATRQVGGVGGNRREAGGPVDEAVQVLRVDGLRDRRPLGAVVNIACHPTVLGPDNRRYSADFVSPLRETLAAAHGAALPVAVFNGACGDVNPGGYSPQATLRGETMPGRTFERAAEIGEQLGNAAAEAFAEAAPTAYPGVGPAGERDGSPRVAAEAVAVKVKLRPHPLPAEAAAHVEDCRRRLAGSPDDSEEQAAARAELAYAQIRATNAATYAKAVDGWSEVPLQGFAVDDWALLAFPTEVFAAHGLALKRGSPFKQTMITAYANASLGYLPQYPPADAAADNVEDYEQRTSLFGPWAVESVIGEAAALLQRLHESVHSPPPAPTNAAVAVKPELVARETHPVGPSMPTIDFHLHWWSHWHRVEDVTARMDAANVRYGVILVGDVFPGCELDPVLELTEPVKDRFCYFTSPDFTDIDAPDWAGRMRAKLERDVANGARGVKLYKDLGLGYTDSTGRLLRPTDPRVKPLWEFAAERKLPVLFHVADPPAFFEPMTPQNERYNQLVSRPSWWWGRPGFPTFDELIDDMFTLARENPATTFVFPHCASLSNDLRRCGELIASSDNIYVDLSARLPQLARQPHQAHEFCVDHAGRVIFGTDDSLPGRNNVYGLWARVLETRDDYFAGDYYGVRQPWRFYGLGLSHDVLQKIYWDNAARLLGLGEAD